MFDVCVSLSSVTFLCVQRPTPTYCPPTIKPFNVANEPILSYLEDSPERRELRSKLDHYSKNVTEIPIVIDGKHYHTDDVINQVCPFDHGHVLAKCSLASADLSHKAIQASLMRSKEWESVDVQQRVDALLRAADLASGKYRQDLNAATMLGQGD